MIDFTKLAEEAAERLRGTVNGLADLGEEFEAAQNNKEFNDTLDSLVFECERCNWWCEISEMSDGGWYCDECEDEE